MRAMMTFTQMREINRARREGAPLGDIAVLKFAALSGPSRDQNERLAALDDPCFVSDMDRLRALPDGTLGREYARHMDRNRLRPLAITPAMKARHADHPYALRTTTTHDLLHTLTGFPTTPAGELGLFAFMIGQGFGPSRLMLWWGALVYSVIAPLHLRGILRNARIGLRMAREAQPLLAAPLEALVELPIDEARARVGLRRETIAAIDPGRRSALIEWMLPKDPPEPAEPGDRAAHPA